MYIYRLMSKPEFIHTKEVPNFNRKYKYFSPSLDFLFNRVLDGKFNNSNFKPERYTHLVCFKINKEDLKHFTKVGRKELQVSVRKTHLIRWKRIF